MIGRCETGILKKTEEILRFFYGRQLAPAALPFCAGCDKLLMDRRQPALMGRKHKKESRIIDEAYPVHPDAPASPARRRADGGTGI